MSLTGGVFKNSKASFTPEDGLCECVHSSVFYDTSESLVMCAICAHESNTIPVQRAVHGVPVAPDTHL